MTNKIIAVGDPHIKLDNFEQFNLFECRLLELIEKECPDMIVVLGDVLHYHEKVFTPCLNRAHQFIKNLGKKVKTMVLVGNHDMINNQQFLTQNHWMNALKNLENITIVDKVVKLEDLIFCPYVFPGRFEEALKTLDEDYHRSSLIFAHQEFKGCKMGAIISEMGDVWLDTNPLVISGHVHLNQWVGEKVYYSGSALQHAFGESEKNIVAVLTRTSYNEFKITEVDLKLPRKKILRCDVEGVDKVIEKIQKSKDSGDEHQIKVSVSGSVEEFKSLKTTPQYKKLIKDGVSVVFKPKQTSSSYVSNHSDYEEFDGILRKLVIADSTKMYKLYEKFIVGL